MDSRQYFSLEDLTIPRVSFKQHDLLYNEKFETWLNLQPVVELINYGSQANDWEHLETLMKGKFTKSSLFFLKENIASPNALGRYLTTPLLPALMVSDILNCKGDLEPGTDVDRIFNEGLEAAGLCTSWQFAHLLSNCDEKFAYERYGNFKDWLRGCKKIPRVVKSAYQVYNSFNNIILKHKEFLMSRRRRGASGSYQNSFSVELKAWDLIFHIGTDLAIIRGWGSSWIIPFNYLQMLHNKCSELFNTLLYAHWQSGSSMPSSFFSDLVTFLKHLSFKVHSQCLHHTNTLEHENKGFLYLKAIEGLGVSELIRRHDKVWDKENDTLCKALWESVYEEKLDNSKAYNTSNLFKIWGKCEGVTIASMLGAVKLCGHPSIEILAGLTSLKEKTTKNIKIDASIRDECMGQMIRDLFANFYKRNNRYPAFKDISSLPHELQMHIRNNMTLASSHVKQLFYQTPLKDWAKVELGKNAEFQIVDDLMLLKDKSLGMTRSQVLELFELGKLGKPRALHERRAILEYILTPDMNKKLNKYLENYLNDEVWSHTVLNYLVIKLTPKELEEKPKGRMFGASPSVERSRRIITEYNSMEYLDKYETCQLLTPDELSILTRLVSFRDFVDTYPDCIIFNISLDFASWCTSHREQVIDVCTKPVLGAYYGTKAYNRNQKTYSHSIIFYHDGFVELMWKGQEGGIEGLNQATWAGPFTAAMKMAFSKLGYRYDVTTKGDDVRAAIIVPKSEVDQYGFQGMRDKIMESVNIICAGLGWTLNPNESFVSTSLIATSKQYLVNKTWFPSDIKKIKKIESHSNLIFLTIDDLISSMFSVAHSSCSATTTFMPAFLLATFSAARLLLGQLIDSPQGSSNMFMRLQGSAGKTSRMELISSLLCWPQVLGGPGCLPLQTFIVRGENDLLSASVSLIRYLTNWDGTSTNAKTILTKIMSQKIRSGDRLGTLLGDPYALDVDCPERPGHILKKFLRETITKIAKNRDIVALSNRATRVDEEKCIRFLTSMHPYMGKLASAIWECTPFALIEEILSKFTESSSIMAMLDKQGRRRVISRRYSKLLNNLTKATLSRWNYWMDTLLSPPKGKPYFGIPESMWMDPNICVTEIVHRIRETCWKVKFSGVTYPSLVDQTVIHIYERGVTNLRVFNDQSNRICEVRAPYKDDHWQTSWKSAHYAHTTGNQKAWLGHKTSSRMHLPDKGDSLRSPVLIKLDKLIAIRVAATEVSADIQKFIDSIIVCYIDMDPIQLQLLAPTGLINHLAHRVQTNAYSLSTMPNSRPNIAQTVLINRPFAEYHHSASENRTINYAARHFYSVGLITIDLQFSSNYKIEGIPPVRFASISFCTKSCDELNTWCCKWCGNIIDDVKITSQPPPGIQSMRYRHLRLVQATTSDKDSIKRGLDNIVSLKSLRFHTKLKAYATREEIFDATVILLSDQYKMSTTTVHKELQADPQSTRGMGLLRSDISHNISSNELEPPKTWINCSPLNLYHSVLQILWSEFVARIAPVSMNWISIDVNIHDDLHTKLAMVMKNIVQGGGLIKLRLGSNASEWRNGPLIFPYGCETNLMLLSKTIWLYVIPIFRKWAVSPRLAPSWVSIMYGTSQEVITNGLKKRIASVSNLLISRVMKSVLRRPPSRSSLQQLVYDHLAWSAGMDCGISDNIKDNYLMYVVLSTCFELECIDIDETIHEINENLDQSSSFLIDELVSVSDLSTEFREILPDGRYDQIDSMLGAVNTRSVHEFLLSKIHQINEFHNDRVRELVIIGIRSLSVFNTVKVYTATKDEIKFIMKQDVFEEPDIMALMVRHNQFTIDKIPLSSPAIPVRQPIMLFSSLDTYVRLEDYLIDQHLSNQYLGEMFNALHPYANNQNLTCSRSRIFGLVNKSIIRYMEIFKSFDMFGLTDHPSPIFVVIGDGGGSVSQYILTTFPRAKVVMTTLRSDLNTLNQALDVSLLDIPINLQGMDPEDVVSRFYSSHIPFGDLCNPVCFDSVVATCKSIDGNVVMVISDADWGTQDCNNSTVGIDFCRSLSRLLSELSYQNHLINITRWMSVTTPPISTLLAMWMSEIGNITLHLSYYSRLFMREIFSISIVRSHAVSTNFSNDNINGFHGVNRLPLPKMRVMLEAVRLKYLERFNRSRTVRKLSWLDDVTQKLLSPFSAICLDAPIRDLEQDSFKCPHQIINDWHDDLLARANISSDRCAVIDQRQHMDTIFGLSSDHVHHLVILIQLSTCQWIIEARGYMSTSANKLNAMPIQAIFLNRFGGTLRDSIIVSDIDVDKALNKADEFSIRLKSWFKYCYIVKSPIVRDCARCMLAGKRSYTFFE